MANSKEEQRRRGFVSERPYSDRSTPVLLIVSLAGIKVCSPDGKVSTDQKYIIKKLEDILDRRVDGFDAETCSARVANPTSLETFGFLSDWHHERIHEAETNAAWISPISLSS
ncbi:hypothetical protein HZH66_003060 [Vespula vulgaris]|uniref:Uncharacterized protein n=1 Tax=Vespula vulgaris TaxID=7454 RepID=A0A834KKR9_VESVU|nr:hypothetical protein HZH66_003060 [Vespula vulgaris]